MAKIIIREADGTKEIDSEDPAYKVCSFKNNDKCEILENGYILLDGNELSKICLSCPSLENWTKSLYLLLT